MKLAAGGLHHGLAWILLWALAACLFLNQYQTLPKLRDLVVAGGAKLHVGQAQAAALDLMRAGWREVLTPSDYVIGVGLIVIILAMVGAELAGRRYSTMLADLEQRPTAMLALLLFLAVVITRYYLNPGAVFMGDATMHIETSAAVAEHLQRLSWPVWSNYWYGGYPLLEFYAPLYFYLVGALTVALGDVHLATKLLLWLAHVGSMVTMYLFLSAALQRRTHALLGALCYGLAYHHMHIIVYRGDLHMALIYLIYPLLFLHLERYVQGRLSIRGAFLACAFTAACLIVSHHAYAFFGLVFFTLYALLRVGAAAPGPAPAMRTLAPIYLALGGGALMCAFLLLPVLFDNRDVRGMPGLPFAILVPTPPAPAFIGAMLHWKLLGDRSNLSYLGLSIAAFALVGAAAALRRRNPVALGLLAAGLYALFTLRSGFQYNVKNMNFIVFYAAALSGFAPAACESWLAARRAVSPAPAARVALVMMALTLVDLGPATFQNVFREHFDFKESMYGRIRARDPNYKVIERQLIFYAPDVDQRHHFDQHMLGSVMPKAPLPSPLGWAHEAAGKSFGYNTEIIKQLHRELHENQISERSLQGLMLMGVKFLTFRDRFHYYTPPLPSSSDYTLDQGLLDLHYARPLIVAPRLIPASSVAGYDPHNEIEARRYFDVQTFDYDSGDYARLITPLLDSMRLDRTTGIATAIPVLGRGAADSGAATTALKVDILDYQLDIVRLRIRYAASARAFAQLAFSFFPYLDVRLDDRPVAFSRSALNYLVMELPAGVHSITVQGRASSLRRTGCMLTLAALAAVLLTPARWLRWLVTPRTQGRPSIAGGRRE